jgi:hypothetical protein
MYDTSCDKVLRFSLSLSLSLSLSAAFFLTLVVSPSNSVAQNGGDFVDPSPPPAIRIIKWDPVTGTWIDCQVTPRHSACNFGGVIPVPIGTGIIPINVGGGGSCGAGGFSLTGNASLPVTCSQASPCVIQGVQVSCSGSGTQITCTFSVAQNGQWVPVGSTTIDPSDIIDVAIDCAGRVTQSVRRFVNEHVTVCPGELMPPSFPVGNPSDPQYPVLKCFEIRF